MKDKQTALCGSLVNNRCEHLEIIKGKFEAKCKKYSKMLKEQSFLYVPTSVCDEENSPKTTKHSRKDTENNPEFIRIKNPARLKDILNCI